MATIVFLVGWVGFTIFVPLYYGVDSIKNKRYLLNRTKTTGEVAVAAGYLLLKGLGIYLVSMALFIVTKQTLFFSFGFISEIIFMWLSSNLAYMGRVRKRH